VTIGQLLFGWAPRGSEGVNRQQIIAASGRLGDRAQVATQIVLRYCYRPRQETFGWAQDQGVEIAFRRTLTGVDGSGRPGAFLAHALVYRPGTVPRHSLGRLWNAGVWHRQPPDDLIDLPALTSLSELELGEPPAVDDRIAETALAHHLANAAAGRKSAVPGDEPAAVATATRIAELLPASVELPSFSTDEDDNARLYDMLAGNTNELFLPLQGALNPDGLWTDAARLLIDAATGDAAASAAVDAATAGAANSREAAERLYACVAVVGAAADGAAVEPHALELAASDPRFAGWLVDRAGMRWVGAPLVAGDRDAATFVGAAIQASRGDRLAEIAPEIVAATTVHGTDTLHELHGMGEPSVPAIARQVVEEWGRAGKLERLSPADGVALLRIIASRGGPPGRAGDLLLGAPALTRDVANAAGLAVGWRAEATARNPTALDPTNLAQLLAHDPGFASELLRRDSPGVRMAITRAIDVADLDMARVAAAAAAAHVDTATGDGWRWHALIRLPPLERYSHMAKLAHARRDLPVQYAETLLDAYVEMITVARASRMRLTPPRPMRVSGDSRRVSAWRAFAKRLERLRSSESAAKARAAVDDAVRLGRIEDVDVALELVFDSCSGAPTEGIWLAAVESARYLAGETAEVSAGRLVRSALRSEPWRRATLGAWVAIWIASRVDDGSLDTKQLDPKEIEALAADLRADSVRDALAERRKSLKRSGGKWVKRLVG
jgi:hypothetical protein